MSARDSSLRSRMTRAGSSLVLEKALFYQLCNIPRLSSLREQRDRRILRGDVCYYLIVGRGFISRRKPPADVVQAAGASPRPTVCSFLRYSYKP